MNESGFTGFSLIPQSYAAIDRLHRSEVLGDSIDASSRLARIKSATSRLAIPRLDVPVTWFDRPARSALLMATNDWLILSVSIGALLARRKICRTIDTRRLLTLGPILSTELLEALFDLSAEFENTLPVTKSGARELVWTQEGLEVLGFSAFARQAWPKSVKLRLVQRLTAKASLLNPIVVDIDEDALDKAVLFLRNLNPGEMNALVAN